MPEGFTSLLPNGLFSVKKEEHRVARRMLVPVSYAMLSLPMQHKAVCTSLCVKGGNKTSTQPFKKGDECVCVVPTCFWPYTHVAKLVAE